MQASHRLRTGYELDIDSQQPMFILNESIGRSDLNFGYRTLPIPYVGHIRESYVFRTVEDDCTIQIFEIDFKEEQVVRSDIHAKEDRPPTCSGRLDLN